MNPPLPTKWPAVKGTVAAWFITRIWILKPDYAAGVRTTKMKILMKKNNHWIHGESKRNSATTEFLAWSGMKGRCYCKTNQKYKDYGGRGIAVCKRWLKSYLSFLSDVGRRPTKGHTLGRINNDGNYEPSNVEWQTPKQQSRNTRSNRIIRIRGMSRPVVEWCEIFGIPAYLVHLRLKYKWPIHMVFDKDISGRPKSMWKTKRGEDHPLRLLTEDQAKVAKHCPRTMKAYESLARKFKVSTGCIMSVRIGQSWNHIK